MKRKMFKTAIAAGMFLVVSLFFIGCDTPIPYLLLQGVSDGAHGGDQEHFYFLPPIVSEPTTSGDFDATAEPTVEICEWDGNACVGEPIETFNDVEVNTIDEYYQVDWSTCDYELEDEKDYKIMVNAYEMTLGYAVVSLATLGDLKNTDTEELIPLEEDRVLPIKFRIEEGIVASCEPASDACCDVDGNTCDDCDDGVHCNMTDDCPYVWGDGKYDPNSGLCWQDPPPTGTMNWNDAVDYCPGTLGSGGRLPTISELRTLVRSGSVAECNVLEWDMEWTTVPIGYCGVWDNCLSASSCWVDSECYPSACGTLEGPGTGGCYWDGALSGTCSYYWSASESADHTDGAWLVNFDYGLVDNRDKPYPNFVRCVRSGP